MAISIDTLKYARLLNAGGVPKKQAETHAEVLSQIIEDQLATKLDIELLRKDILKTQKELELGQEVILKELENKLTLRMAAMLITATGVIVTITGLLIKFL